MSFTGERRKRPRVSNTEMESAASTDDAAPLTVPPLFQSIRLSYGFKNGAMQLRIRCHPDCEFRIAVTSDAMQLARLQHIDENEVEKKLFCLKLQSNIAAKIDPTGKYSTLDSLQRFGFCQQKREDIRGIAKRFVNQKCGEPQSLLGNISTPPTWEAETSNDASVNRFGAPSAPELPTHLFNEIELNYSLLGGSITANMSYKRKNGTLRKFTLKITSDVMQVAGFTHSNENIAAKELFYTELKDYIAVALDQSGQYSALSSGQRFAFLAENKEALRKSHQNFLSQKFGESMFLQHGMPTVLTGTANVFTDSAAMATGFPMGSADSLESFGDGVGVDYWDQMFGEDETPITSSLFLTGPSMEGGASSVAFQAGLPAMPPPLQFNGVASNWWDENPEGDAFVEGAAPAAPPPTDDSWFFDLWNEA